MKPNMSGTLATRLAQPHNAYNIFFMLERQRLIHEMERSCGTAAIDHHQHLSYDLAGYDFLTLPDFPLRYQNLQMPEGWFVPGKNSKRKHVRSHGRELPDVDGIFARSVNVLIAFLSFFLSSCDSNIICRTCTDRGSELEVR
jgi:hypothetical protein